MSAQGKLAGLGLLSGRTLIIIIACALSVAVVDQSKLAVDWSSNGTFTVHPLLAEQLTAIDEPTSIVAIWPERPEVSEEWITDLGQVLAPRLEAMAALNEYFRYQHIDNHLDKPLLEQQLQQWGDASPGAVYLLRENKRPFRIPFTSLLPLVIEREIGGGLGTLALASQQRIALIQGHGELRPQGGGSEGVDAFIRIAELSGFDLGLFDQRSLDQIGRLPAQSIVVLAGPTAALGDKLIKAIDRHLIDGGALLLLADDRLDPALARMLRKHGIFIAAGYREPDRNDVSVIDPTSAPAVPQVIYSADFSIGRDGSYHRLVLPPDRTLVEGATGINEQAAASGRLLMSERSTVLGALDPEAFPKAMATYLDAGAPQFSTQTLIEIPSGSSWLGIPTPRQRVPNLGSDDPGDRAAIAWEFNVNANGAGERGARVIVWGSRQAAANDALLEDRYANGILLGDMLAWLGNRGENVAIPPSTIKAFRADADSSTLTIILAILVAIIPCSFLGGAMITWWDRR